MVETTAMAIFNKPDPRRDRYDQLRQVVTLGIANFRKTGLALKEIRDGELWKLDCATWSECCKRHWGISQQHAGRLIDAALFADQVEPTGSIPKTESQARPFRSLPPEERVEAWKEAVAAGGTPDAIATAVATRHPRRSIPKRPKPLRFRVPGATVVIEPNKRFHGAEESLRFAIEMIAKKKLAA